LEGVQGLLLRLLLLFLLLLLRLLLLWGKLRQGLVVRETLNIAAEVPAVLLRREGRRGEHVDPTSTTTTKRRSWLRLMRRTALINDVHPIVPEDRQPSISPRCVVPSLSPLTKLRAQVLTVRT
jgi:hypothetical protein